MSSVIITNDGASLFIDNKSYTVSSEHPNFNAVIDAARKGAWSSIPALVDIVQAINTAIQKTGNRQLVIKDKVVVYKHISFPDDISQYVINLVRDNYDLSPITNFMDKLLANPDHRIFQQLFGFLAYGKNPITPSGNLLAYKKIRHDYKSVHDGVTDHSIGKTVEMERSACNDNPEQTCSTGLHFCSRDYLSNFGGDRVVVVEISPTDVVSIPVDYNNTKGRACKYVVVGELSDIELKMVADTDVLKVATVETKYSAPKNAAPVEPLLNSDIDATLYSTGYKDGRNKAIQTSKDASYLIGYKDGRSKKKRKVVAGSTAIVATSEPEQVVQVSSDADQYSAGYTDGRNKAVKSSSSDSYLQGYKDGHGKKKRKFNAVVVQAVYNVAMYTAGYNDGRKKLASGNTSPEYLQGYKDGRGKKKRLYKA